MFNFKTTFFNFFLIYIILQVFTCFSRRHVSSVLSPFQRVNRKGFSFVFTIQCARLFSTKKRLNSNNCEITEKRQKLRVKKS